MKKLRIVGGGVRYKVIGKGINSSGVLPKWYANELAKCGKPVAGDYGICINGKMFLETEQEKKENE